VEAEDGWVDATRYVRLFHPKIVDFSVLCHRESLVFYFGL
jgi:hypothetical protein